MPVQTQPVARTPAEETEEDLFRSVFETSHVGMVIADRQARFSVWNHRFADLFEAPPGMRDPDALQRHVAEKLDEGGAFVDAVSRLASDSTTHTREVVRCRDGRSFEQTSRPVHGGRVWTFEDVTTQVQTEVALRRSEARYRDLYNKTPVMMHSIDHTGRIVSVSDTWLETLGYAREEVIGRKSTEFLTPESRRYAVEEVLPAFFDSGSCRDVHYQFKKRSGEIIDVLLSATAERKVDGTVLRSLAVLIDVTERLRVQAERDRAHRGERVARTAAQEALALLDTIFRKAPVGLAFLDSELRFIRINDRLATLHGVAPDDAIGRTVWEVAPEVADSVAPDLSRAMREEREMTNIETDAELRDAPGELRTFLSSYYPVRAGSRVVGVGAVVVDVTEQKKVAAQNARLYREAQEALRLRDDFLAVAAHELRTPLTPLALSLQVIDSRVRSGLPVDVPAVERALRQLDKLDRVIEDLLDSSQVELAVIPIRSDPVSFTGVVEQALRAVREAAPRHPFEVDVSHEPLVVIGDRQRLARVVQSLLDNAVKYSPPGSPIRVSLARSDGDARLAVTDRGLGIPPDEMPRLFDRFFRARNAPVTQYGGFGLDLYISRHIVELHGGRIWAESRLGEGSTFFVTLPLAPPSATLESGDRRR